MFCGLPPFLSDEVTDYKYASLHLPFIHAGLQGQIKRWGCYLYGLYRLYTPLSLGNLDILGYYIAGIQVVAFSTFNGQF